MTGLVYWILFGWFAVLSQIGLVAIGTLFGQRLAAKANAAIDTLPGAVAPAPAAPSAGKP